MWTFPLRDAARKVPILREDQAVLKIPTHRQQLFSFATDGEPTLPMRSLRVVSENVRGVGDQ